MKMELPEIRPEERTPLVEALLAIIRALLDRNQQLEELVVQLRDEIAILKGQKPRPKIKPVVLRRPRHHPAGRFEKRTARAAPRIGETFQERRVDHSSPGAAGDGQPSRRHRLQGL